MGIVWGRRRVGKTALLQRLADGRRSVYHTATGRPLGDELRLLHAACRDAGVLRSDDGLGDRFVDLDHALATLAGVASEEPLLVVLDEFPELVATAPELPNVLRAFWDKAQGSTQLRLLVAGSAMHAMTAMLDERAPLFGRFDLRLQLHPFEPADAALMLTDLAAADRALVWGICGGMPHYLSLWDQGHSVRHNVRRLFCQPGAPLLTEGSLVLASELSAGDLARRVLYAIALGRTRHNEIADTVRADPTRVLETLVDLRLVERLTPVTEDPRRTRRRIYRVSDNFLAFWLGAVDRYRSEIDRSLGDTIVDALVADLDRHMGPVWEEAVRWHLRRMVREGALTDGVAVGPYWTDARESVEIDAVVLAGRDRVAVAVAEAKWARRVDGVRLAADLRRKAAFLPRVADGLITVVAAREEVRGPLPERTLAVTAADVFSPT